jgi:Protein of unknown function (DUF3309)
MNIIGLLIVVLIVAIVLGAPGIGPIHHGYGYWPSGLGIILVIVLVLLLLRG